MAVQSSSPRSWFPGRLVPLARLARFEALGSAHRRVQVQVGRDTVFGTPAQAMATGLALVKAAIEADPSMREQLHPARVRAALNS